MGKEDEKIKQPTQEDIRKLTSGYQAREATLNKSLTTLQDQVDDLTTRLEEAKLAGEEPGSIEEIRTDLVSRSRDLTKTKKDLTTETTRADAAESANARLRIAAKHGVPESELAEISTEKEMDIRAREIKLEKGEEGEKGAPSKGEFDLNPGSGTDQSKELSDAAAISQGWKDRDNK